MILFVLTLKFNKKTAVFAVILAALLLLGIVLLASAHSKAEKLEQLTSQSNGTVTRVQSETERAAYLAQFGWEVETPALSHETVVIPRSFSDVFAQYNELQKQQGFDLTNLAGMEVEIYTYQVTNSEPDTEVVAQLYVRNSQVVGGDVHSTALDGFMVGIKSS